MKGEKLLSLPKWKREAKEKLANDAYDPASYRSMMRYATKSDWILLIVGVVCSAGNGAVSSAILMLFGRIVNAIVQSQTLYDAGNLDSIENSRGFKAELLDCSIIYFCAVLIILLLGFFGVQNPIEWRSFCLHLACERQIARIQQKFLQQVLNQNVSWLDENEVGKLTQKMTAGVESMHSGTGKSLSLIIYALANCVTGTTMAFAINWRVSIVMVGFLPLLFISIYGSGKAVKSIMRKEAKVYGLANCVVEEVLSGIRTVMSFNAQYFELERFGKHVKCGYLYGVRKVKYTAFFSAMYNLVIFSSMGVLFWYGSNLALSGDVTIGTVQGIFWLFALAAIRLGQAAPQISSFLNARLAAAELFAVIDRVPELDCASVNGDKPSTCEGEITFENIHFRYPSRPDVKVLDGISFSVNRGQNVALVGSSGSGKSTLTGLLLRFYDPEKGTIKIDGKPVNTLNCEWLRRTIGVVSQNPVVFSGTVAQNLRLGRSDLTETEMREVCRLANAEEFIEKLPNGYETKIGDGGIKLSGGQCQRLAIARTLSRNPKILVLDEATAALDNESERAVQTALDQAAENRTTLTIAHRLSTIRNATRILVFDKGVIAECGDHEELMSKPNGLYRRLVLAQELEKAAQLEDAVSSEADDVNSVKTELKSKQGSVLSRSGLRRTLEHYHMSSARSSLGTIQFDLEPELTESKAGNAVKTEPASILAILRFAWSEKYLVFIGLFLTLLRGIAWPIYTLLLGSWYRNFAQVESLSYEHMAFQNVITGCSFVGLAIFSSVLTLTSGMMLGVTGERITRRLRLGVFKNFLQQDASYFDRSDCAVGHLTARLSIEAPCVQAAIDQRLADVLQASTSFVIGIVVGIWLDWSVSLVAITAVSIMLGAQLMVLETLKRKMIAHARVEEGAARIASEAIEHVRTVQALTQQNTIYEQFCAACELPHRQTITRGYWQAASFAMSCCSEEWNFAVIYGIAAFMITAGQVEPIRAYQCISVINAGIIMTFLPAASYIPEFLRAKTAAGSLFKMLEEKKGIDGMSNEGSKPEFHGNIEIKHAYFAYPNQKQLVLKDFNITAFRGQTLAFIGASGCGKSTVIQLLDRFYDLLSGSIKIDGVDIREINIRHLRSNISLVPQSATLFNLTIGQNIAYGLKDVTENQIMEAAKLANIDGFIRSLPLGMNTMVGAKGTQLSGGQKQRISIARAVIRNPKILLLDEATSALDNTSEKLVQEALEKASEGRTCITIAHRLSSIQNSDLIVGVKDGHVVEQGTHQQLLSRKGLYYRLAGTRNE
ncbi:Multidrug resistance protein pgp-3 [Aphelenchoides besseyi]|nr:Multidrug resistance protein pgp-3 [Aphelenchoides besseyi]